MTNRSDTGPAPRSILYAARVRCLVALNAYRRRTALGPGMLAAGPASSHTLLPTGSARASFSAIHGGGRLIPRSRCTATSTPTRGCTSRRTCRTRRWPTRDAAIASSASCGSASALRVQFDPQRLRQRRGALERTPQRDWFARAPYGSSASGRHGRGGARVVLRGRRRHIRLLTLALCVGHEGRHGAPVGKLEPELSPPHVLERSANDHTPLPQMFQWTCPVAP
jgi:hypothetical protein